MPAPTRIGAAVVPSGSAGRVSVLTSRPSMKKEISLRLLVPSASTFERRVTATRTNRFGAIPCVERAECSAWCSSW